MKKYLFLLLTAAIAAACSMAETDVPGTAAGPDVTDITATIVDRPSTRTAYTVDEAASKARFAWKAGDVVDVAVRCSSGYTGVPFTAQEGGTTARFLDGQTEGDLTVNDLLALDPGAVRSDWAFYPSRTGAEALQGGFNLEWDIRTVSGQEVVTVDLPSRMTLPAGNPLAIVPLAGRLKGNGDYDFVPITGVLGVTVTGLPDEADYIRIESADAALAGSFRMDATATEITQSGVQTALQEGMTLYFSGISDTYTFYFPVAAGTIPAGLTLTAGSSTDPEILMQVSTVMPITVRTGVIAQCPALAFTPVDQQWARVADGEFLDDFIWAQHSLYTAGTWVGVTVERSGLHPEKYRINNPYRVANTLFGYTPYATGGSDDYLVFTLLEDDLVSFNQFRTGVEDKDSGGRLMMITYPPAWSSSRPATENKVVSWRRDGMPAEVQLAAVYSQYEDPASYMYSRDGSTQHTDRIHLKLIDDSPETWTAVGTGSYKDNFIFNNRLGYPADTYTDVTVEQSSRSDSRFRIANPYPALAASLGYSIPEAYTTAVDPYLVFEVASDGLVSFTTFRPGIGDTSRELALCHPATWTTLTGTSKNPANNKVLGLQQSGLPTAVQLAPIYYNPGDYSYFYSRDTYSDIVVLNFPADAEETWTSVGTGRFLDEYLWKNNTFAPYAVEVEIFRSDADPNRYRFENPYAVACTAFKHTAPGSGDAYVYLTVDPSTGLVVYEDILTGMDRASDGRNYVAAHPASWNARKGTSLSVADSKVASGTAAAPLEIQLSGVYFDSADETYFYTNATGLKHLWFPAFYAGETWTDYCEGTYKDNTYDAKINGTASALGTVPVVIQRSSLDNRRFRIANPYRSLTDVLVTSFDPYLYFQTGDGLVYFEPFRPGVVMDGAPKELGIYHPVNSNLMGWSQGGSDFTGNSVLSGTDAEPAKLQLGAHYFDIATPNPGYCYTRQGSAWGEDDRIVITFGPADKVVATAYELPLKPAFHNPVSSLSMPAGTLQRIVVKITGDLTRVTGLRLWQDSIGGWMNSDYVAPDANGVVTIDSFSNATVAGSIDLNFWATEVMGSSFKFEIQEVVVDGTSLFISQDSTVPHIGGVVVNNGGDTETIRGNAMTVNSFRIPALVTSRAGTLIAAYDVRYDGSADLQNDINVGVKRSTDGGKTWSSLIIAMDMGITGYESEVAAGTMTEKQARQNNGIGDPCLLVDENTGRLFCFAVWAHGHKNDSDSRCLAWAGKGFGVDDTPQLMMVYSDNDGVSWSGPVNITRQIKKYDWRMTFQGPGRGITMKDGTLVIPIQHQEGESKSMHNLYPLNSGIAYSTDHGLTWHAHNFAHTITSEAAVAEIEPGVLLLSMRDETDSHYRRNYVTTDMGRTWQAHSSNGTWLDSTCEASLLHVDASQNALGEDLLLFSNPHNTSRSKMTIQASLDKGATFAGALQVDSGGSLGYSCLTMIDRNTVGILYESSRASIFFQAIPLTDIIHQ